MTGFVQEAGIEGKLRHVSNGQKTKFRDNQCTPASPPQSGNWKGTPISLSTFFSEDRYTLFRIMLQETALISNPSRPTRAHEGW
jgi:hypothetical protein